MCLLLTCLVHAHNLGCYGWPLHWLASEHYRGSQPVICPLITVRKDNEGWPSGSDDNANNGNMM